MCVAAISSSPSTLTPDTILLLQTLVLDLVTEDDIVSGRLTALQAAIFAQDRLGPAGQERGISPLPALLGVATHCEPRVGP